MNRHLKIVRISSLLIMILLVAGCTVAPTAPAPTMDLNPLKTEVAKTVLAEVKAQATTAPSATPVPPTKTNTPQPPVATATSTSTVLVPTLPPTLAPTATKPAVVFVPSNTPSRSDVAVLVAQRPGDGTTMTAGGDFDTVWRIKNIGRKNWSTAYYVKYQGGDNFATNNLYMLTGPVNTGDEIDVVVDCIAPRQPGSYLMRWSLVNDNGEAFYTVSIRIAVK